ncbi:hypothetical protein ROSALIND_6 [Paenibacillus phage Rosalind]|uniref:Uncharacterized protein n=6 Tax=Gochnauervirinae TaxID=2842525 RepID=A0A0K2CZ97_9CAUD|nr:hypothetical protein HARRISON_6 [Paenibacillus phage Harrison]YP_009196105.1 hypothetical protein VEGAS_6 [Paenibacillus phage Vegas]ALA12572.1 hypothetical protein PAISLEY_6 [Paenibacillus phage Paisley]ALA12742.1 hypothetical protein HAYLEY_6 [Paenibacillus phage Hayley]ALA12826.1 hypothetical protein VADIM_6 [Paenibacillus phage Vadim]ALA12912.1 hypothetical protein DIANE_6 [Paenibacillus phage Diane]UYE92031.1 hypothetical protein LUNBUN_6 [Paenibacillus phage LunBun]UYE92113.1 hypoth
MLKLKLPNPSPGEPERPDKPEQPEQPKKELAEAEPAGTPKPKRRKADDVNG